MKQLVSLRLTKAQIARIEKLASLMENDDQQTERVSRSFVVRLALNEGLKELERLNHHVLEGK